MQRWVGAVAAAALFHAVCCGFRLLMQPLCRINCRPYLHSKGLAKRTQGSQKMAMLSLPLSRHVPLSRKALLLLRPASKYMACSYTRQSCQHRGNCGGFEGGCCLTRAGGHLAPSSCGAPLPRSSHCCCCRCVEALHKCKADTQPLTQADERSGRARGAPRLAPPHRPPPAAAPAQHGAERRKQRRDAEAGPLGRPAWRRPALRPGLAKLKLQGRRRRQVRLR